MVKILGLSGSLHNARFGAGNAMAAARLPIETSVVLEVEMRPRASKPRQDSGLTSILDSGLGTYGLADILETAGAYIDFVKFGWGSSAVSANLPAKIAMLQQHGVDFWFGGTLFELAYTQGRVDNLAEWAKSLGARHFEISDGSIEIPHHEKLSLIERFSRDFVVLSEVGSKDSRKVMSPSHWIEHIRSELDAGAWKIIAEGREGGNAGMYRPSGELRTGLIQEILESGVPASNLFFETSRKNDQVWFLENVGFDVNLANIAPGEALNLETLRRGLRNDTLFKVAKVAP
jgi:phosphosulfolactate synthase